MKIIKENIVHVQLNDIAFLNQTDLPIPASIFLKLFGSGSFIVANQNRFDFISFTSPEEIEFFSKLDWIVDYDSVRDLSDYDLVQMINGLSAEQGRLAETYMRMSQEAKEQNRGIAQQGSYIGFKIASLEDFILYKEGKINMTLPADVEEDIIEMPLEKPQSKLQLLLERLNKSKKQEKKS